MRPAECIARAFLLNGGAHLCARASCDCIRELTIVIERERAAAVASFRHHQRLARLAKPRIADALKDTREAIRKRA